MFSFWRRETHCFFAALVISSCPEVGNAVKDLLLTYYTRKQLQRTELNQEAARLEGRLDFTQIHFSFRSLLSELALCSEGNCILLLTDALPARTLDHSDWMPASNLSPGL